MTILHVSTPASWRGGEQQAAYLVKAIHDTGLEQVVLTVENSALSNHLMELSIPVATFPSRGFLDLKLARRISDLCKHRAFSIIHCHDSHAHSGAVLASSIFGINIPIVVSRRVDFAVSPTPFSKWKYNHKMIRRIICVSETISRITEPAIRDKSKLMVVHSGIDLSNYTNSACTLNLQKELSLPPDTKLIGNLSALADHKDYPTFIKTAAVILAEAPDIHFIIAGAGPEEKKISKIIRALNLEDNIHMLGFRKDPVCVMQSLDLFLITSTTEGLGTIVLEAFAAGVPVVATRAGGIPEMVENGVTGLLAPPRDANALAKAVLQIIHDPAMGQQLTRNALERVKAFSYQATSEKTLAGYRKAIQSAK